MLDPRLFILDVHSKAGVKNDENPIFNTDMGQRRMPQQTYPLGHARGGPE